MIHNYFVKVIPRLWHDDDEVVVVVVVDDDVDDDDDDDDDDCVLFRHFIAFRKAKDLRIRLIHFTIEKR